MVIQLNFTNPLQISRELLQDTLKVNLLDPNMIRGT